MPQTKDDAYYMQRARAWMRAANVLDLRIAKALIRPIISLSNLKDGEKVTVSSGDVSAELNADTYKGAKEVQRGINLLIKAGKRR